MGLVLLMWMSTFLAAGIRGEHFDHAPLSGQREVTHVLCTLGRDLLAQHLVVAPERAIDQQTVGLRENFVQLRFNPTQARSIEERASGRLVPHQDAHIVAFARLLPVRRVRRRLAHQGNGAEAQARDPIHSEVRIPVGVHALPVDAAIVVENVEYGVAGGEVLAHAIGRVHAQRLAFAQHEQARRMIDLTVDQDNADDRGVAQRTPGLQTRETAQLNEDVGRRVEQDPVDAVGTQRE